MVSRASSVTIEDPAKHWACVDGIGADHPRLLAKRITVEQIRLWLKDKEACPFKFEPAAAPLKLSHSSLLRTLQQKMNRGDLTGQVETMAQRARSAERHLLEEALARPDQTNAILNQLESIVKGECDEAYLTASKLPEPFGAAMLEDVFRRLRHVASERGKMVYHKEYECLVGVAGLLTEDCRVWWSPPFDLQEPQQ